MALKDKIPFGVSLPHRSPDPIDTATVRAVAQRAEALGFRDLWVTENTLDHVTCFDPVVVLTYAAAVTSRNWPLVAKRNTWDAISPSMTTSSNLSLFRSPTRQRR